MRKPLAHPLMKAAASACLLAAIVVSPATTFGQTTEDPLPSPTLPFEPETEGDESEASSDPTQLREKLPDSAIERAKMLDNLYALLATAESPEAAEKTSKAIMRLWAYSGSDTVTVLMARAVKAMQQKIPSWPCVCWTLLSSRRLITRRAGANVHTFSIWKGRLIAL